MVAILGTNRDEGLCRLAQVSWESLMLVLEMDSCYYLLYVSAFLIRIVFITYYGEVYG